MKKTKLNKVSKTGAIRRRAYIKIRNNYLLLNPICEVCGDRLATEIHHKKGRIGTLLCDDRYFLAVDPICHQTIEFNRTWAMKNKYSLDRLAK